MVAGNGSSSLKMDSAKPNNKPLRFDRNLDGGGVMIAVKDCYTLTKVNLPDTPAEIIWGEVSLQNKSKLFLGGYYRTPSGHAVTQQTEFE